MIIVNPNRTSGIGTLVVASHNHKPIAFMGIEANPRSTKPLYQ